MLKKLVQNEYTALYKENELRESTLNMKDRDFLHQVCARMAGYTWNRYEIERVRKDLIGMAAQAEARDSDLHGVLGCTPDEYSRQIVDGIDRGSPLDFVCIDYPLLYLILACLNVMALVASGGTASGNLVLHLVQPFMVILWLVIGAWVYRKGYELSLQFGVWTELGWILLFLVLFVGLSLFWAILLRIIPYRCRWDMWWCISWPGWQVPSGGRIPAITGMPGGIPGGNNPSCKT